jgi:hypothetical protein
MYDEAREWVSSGDRSWLFSFENICDTLEINAEYVRRGLREWRDRNQHGRRPRVLPPAESSPGLRKATA